MSRQAIQPMLASPPDGGHEGNEALAARLTATGEWAFEPKYDGVRVTAQVWHHGTMDAPTGVVLHTRNGNDVTARFPEVERALLHFPSGAYDGEIINGAQGGNFGDAVRRIHLNPAAAERDAERNPCTYLLFDLPPTGIPSTRLPQHKRSDRLLEIVDQVSANERLEPETRHVRAVLPIFDGTMLYRHAVQRGWEGLIAKRITASYRPGRSPDWLKLKILRTASFVVCGWEEGEGSRAGKIGALRLAVVHDGQVIEVGKVGTGFNDAELERLKTDYIDKDRFFVVEVEYQAYTEGGKLRFPVYRGQRFDQTWHDATLDQLTKEART